MTIMWSACSFSCYMLNYMNKYLEGTIYQNHYSEGFAGVCAILVGAQVYALIGKKKAFIISYLLALTGGFTIYLMESGLFAFPQSYLN